jgi:hypothetical protein
MRSECHTSEDPGNLLRYGGSCALRRPNTVLYDGFSRTKPPAQGAGDFKRMAISFLDAYPLPVLTADGKLDFSPK